MGMGIRVKGEFGDGTNCKILVNLNLIFSHFLCIFRIRNRPLNSPLHISLNKTLRHNSWSDFTLNISNIRFTATDLKSQKPQCGRSVNIHDFDVVYWRLLKNFVFRH